MSLSFSLLLVSSIPFPVPLWAYYKEILQDVHIFFLRNFFHFSFHRLMEMISNLDGWQFRSRRSRILMLLVLHNQSNILDRCRCIWWWEWNFSRHFPSLRKTIVFFLFCSQSKWIRSWCEGNAMMMMMKWSIRTHSVIFFYFLWINFESGQISISNGLISILIIEKGLDYIWTISFE